MTDLPAARDDPAGASEAILGTRRDHPRGRGKNGPDGQHRSVFGAILVVRRRRRPGPDPLERRGSSPMGIRRDEPGVPRPVYPTRPGRVLPVHRRGGAGVLVVPPLDRPAWVEPAATGAGRGGGPGAVPPPQAAPRRRPPGPVAGRIDPGGDRVLVRRAAAGRGGRGPSATAGIRRPISRRPINYLLPFHMLAAGPIQAYDDFVAQPAVPPPPTTRRPWRRWSGSRGPVQEVHPGQLHRPLLPDRVPRAGAVRPARDAIQLSLDLPGFQRLQRHRRGPGGADRRGDARELQSTLPGAERDRVLGAVAHLALAVHPPQPVHPDPARPGAADGRPLAVAGGQRRRSPCPSCSAASGTASACRGWRGAPSRPRGWSCATSIGMPDEEARAARASIDTWPTGGSTWRPWS